MAPSIPTLPLNDKRAIPAIAFGTGTALFGRDATAYVVQALEGGFNHIDTAQVYRNEESVGEALREAFKKEKGSVVDEKGDVEGQTIGKVARDEIWVTTKYGGAGNAEDALDLSLKKVRTTWILFIPYLPCTNDYTVSSSDSLMSTCISFTGLNSRQIFSRHGPRWRRPLHMAKPST